MTGQHRSTRRRTSSDATLPTTHVTWTGSRSNPVLRFERPATNHLSHGMTFKHLNWSTLQDSVCTSHRPLWLPIQDQSANFFNRNITGFYCRSIWNTLRLHTFSKSRGTTTKSSAPEGWQETSSRLRSYTSTPQSGSSWTVLGWTLPLPLPLPSTSTIRKLVAKTT